MIKKYPFIKQTGLKDCAAACTYMIIKYYKGFTSMNKLSEMLKTTRNGTSAYHIVSVLDSLGFKAYGIKGNYEDLKTQHSPFIANVIINNSYKHFIVVYEIHDRYLLIADPAEKIYKMKVENFKKIWTGISLHMYPVKPILKMKNESLLKFFKTLVISNKKYLIMIFILSLLVTLLSLVTSFFLQIVFDNIKASFLSQIFLCFFLLFISKIILEFFRNLILIYLNKNIDKTLTNKVFKKIIHLPYSYYHNRTTGEVISRINDLSYVQSLISNVSLSLFIDLPLSIITMFVLICLNAQLFIIVFLIFALYLLIIIIFKKSLRSLIFKENYEKAKVTGYMTECIRGFETIKGLGIEKKVINKFQKLYQRKINCNFKLNKFYNYIFLLKEFVNVIGQLLLIYTAILLVQKGLMLETKLLTYIILTAYFLTAIRHMLDFDLEIKEAREAINRILDLTYYENEKQVKKSLLNLNIKIHNLNYSYDDINMVLKNINLEIKKGEKILISGPSGSGKSTLLKIIMKFYKVKDNMVKLGKRDINTVDSNTITNNIVYVGQNEVFFTGPLLHNLTLRGDDYKKAVQMSLSNDIIAKEELGYYTLLEENAFNLSGGQKQRLSIARALQKFEIILIDEGFSQIDVNMERQILKNIFQTYKDKTVIVVSHRLDNLDLFERYIDMHSGKIIIDEKRR